MADGKTQTALGFSVIAITKHLMKYFAINHEDAYRKLVNTDFYILLTDPETGLYLETDQYLCKGCLLELEEGKDAMYRYINQE